MRCCQPPASDWRRSDRRDAQARDVASEDPLGRRSRLPAVLERRPLTAQRAATIIGSYTFVVTLLGGTLAWLLDRKDFHSLGAAVWWALQTVTTVGYGDVVPHSTVGRAVGVFIMISGIGFLTVITASVTAALIEAARGRMRSGPEADVSTRLDEISARLAAIEERLGEQQPPR